MAACSEHELTAEGDDSHAAADVSGWTNSQDSDSQQRRSDIIKIITRSSRTSGNRSLDHLRTILGSGWDVNEILNAWNKAVPSTALHEAARQGWTEGVKLLLDAGAKCDILGNPLKLALRSRKCPPDLIQLLLKHGADPNGHDDRLENIPLLCAIQRFLHNPHHDTNVGYDSYNQNATRIVELLLEQGADPNITEEGNYRRKHCLLTRILNEKFQVFVVLFKYLVRFGADVNYNVDGTLPVLHRMLFKSVTRDGHRDQLDLLFLHGGNINVEDGKNWTALKCAVAQRAHSNSVRWLIRHGADTSSMEVSLLRLQFRPDWGMKPYLYTCTPLVLLQTGLRVSPQAHALFSNMEMTFSSWPRDSLAARGNNKYLQAMWDQLEKVEREELEAMQLKSTFPEYWTRQMVDLQEFSDESLQCYPEINSTKLVNWQVILDQIRRVLAFLSQTQSLQWYCRRCVRENLVSLQPSVVKALPIPARLKRYIMCHEI